MWNYKAIDVINGHIGRMDEKYVAMVEGIELCRTGDIDLKPFLHSYPLEKITDAFSDLTDPDKQVFKAVIQYD